MPQTEDPHLFEHSDRGRLIVAATLTVVALPFLWSSKQQASGPESVAAIGAGDAVATATPPAAVTAASAQDSSAFLAAPASNPDVTLVPPVVTIDVAPAPSGTELSGDASYRRFGSDPVGADNPCATDRVPFQSRIVVTNTDNGFRIECTNVSTKPLPTGTVIVLDTDVFLGLADLGDSPIPVQISW